MPYVRALPSPLRTLSSLGELGELPSAITQWQAEVRARGNVPTRMPKGPNVGKLAERYKDRQGDYRYALASAAALAADAAIAAGLQSTIASGQKVEAVQTYAKQVGDVLKKEVALVADAPRAVVGGILGLPKWAVTAGVVGILALAVKTLLPTLPSIATSHLTRRNPPRRRRSPGRVHARRRSARRMHRSARR